MPYRIDISRCMICRVCQDNCPVQAIDYEQNHLTVHEDKCIDCGLCEKNCHSAAISRVGAVKETKPHEPVSLEADLVVLGGGISGLTAAVRAAQLSGKKVDVMEKSAHVGGNAWFGHAYIPYGTKWEIEAGGGYDCREDFIKWIKSFYGDKFRDGLVRNSVYASGEFFDWLVSLDEEQAKECWFVQPNKALWFQPGFPPKWNVEFKERKFFHMNCPDPCMGPGWGGSYTIKILMEKAKELGIDVLCNTRATKLELDETGCFAGVLGADEGGTVHVSARACVMATGNCLYNDELIRKQWPLFFGEEGDEPTLRYGIAGNTGDVIGLAESIGVHVDPANLRVNMFGPVHHPFDYNFFMYCMQPEIVFFNMEGQRFFNEGKFDGGSAVFHKQPKRKSWAILDAEAFEIFGQRVAGGDLEHTTASLDPTNHMAHYRENVEQELSYEFPMFRADTIEELAEKCGIEPQKLADGLARYNDFCAKGEDPDFGKPAEFLRPVVKAPFYAILGKMATDQTCIGTRISDTCEMLRDDKSVIPGIWVTGDNAADWCLGMEVGPGEHRAHIMSDMTWAVSSGYIAGREAADYLTKE